MTIAPADVRPALRGYIHLAAALTSPFAVLYLMLVADSPAAYVGGAIFGASMILLFSTSASFHLIPWRASVYNVVKRVDHSAIFILIAGSYTPFCLQVLGWGWGIPVLSTVWGLAAIGIALTIGWPHQPRWLGTAAYLAVGWTALAAIPPLFANLEPGPLAVLITSGVLFSAGGAAYAMRWPNPAPRVFAHHEVFHALMTAGCAGVYGVVALSILPS
ncbi:MAG: hemolysin III family protein [Dehalococcoidia bacterium]